MVWPSWGAAGAKVSSGVLCQKLLPRCKQLASISNQLMLLSFCPKVFPLGSVFIYNVLFFISGTAQQYIKAEFISNRKQFIVFLWQRDAGSIMVTVFRGHGKMLKRQSDLKPSPLSFMALRLHWFSIYTSGEFISFSVTGLHSFSFFAY